MKRTQSASNNGNESRQSTDQLPSSLSIETLHKIVRNYHRNEEHLRELERQTRSERKKAQRLLDETHYEQNFADLKSKQQQQSVQFFIPYNNDPSKKIKTRRRKKTPREQSSLPMTIDSTPRVRFNVPETNVKVELDELLRQCEDLLSRLHVHHSQIKNLNNETLHLTPRASSHSNITTPQELKQNNDQSQQDLMSEIQRRNFLRIEIIRIRLRQHELLHNRTNIK